MRMTNIKSICYQLYVVNTFKEYYEYCLENDTPSSSILSYDDYLYESNDRKYCILPEFLDYKYQDKEYIKELLSSDILYNEYLKDINKEEDEVTLNPAEAKELFKYFSEHVDENNNYYGSKSIPNKIVIDGDLDFEDFGVQYLPDNLTVNGYLDLSNSTFKKIPKNLVVNGSLYLDDTDITEIPSDLIVKGNLDISNTYIKELPNDLVINGDLELYDVSINELPQKMVVKGEIRCNTPLKRKLTVGMLLEYVQKLEHKGFTKENIKKLNICLGDDNSKEFTVISNNQNSIIIS